MVTYRCPTVRWIVKMTIKSVWQMQTTHQVAVRRLIVITRRSPRPTISITPTTATSTATDRRNEDHGRRSKRSNSNNWNQPLPPHRNQRGTREKNWRVKQDWRCVWFKSGFKIDVRKNDASNNRLLAVDHADTITDVLPRVGPMMIRKWFLIQASIISQVCSRLRERGTRQTLLYLDGFQGDFMYQGPPSQSYNDFLMQQELHQRLSYGPPPPQGPPPPPGGRFHWRRHFLHQCLRSFQSRSFLSDAPWTNQWSTSDSAWIHRHRFRRSAATLPQYWK